MVTFICENCDQTLRKNQIDRHLYQCRGTPRFVCIDCNKTFMGNDHKAHTSCISEHEKTMGQYYKPKKKPGQNQNDQTKTEPQKNSSTSASIPEKKEEIVEKEQSNEKWVGWKKTIRKTLQKQNNSQMNVGKLKGLILKEFLRTNGGVEKEVEAVFQEKIKNSRFQIKGDVVKYIPKSVRLVQN